MSIGDLKSSITFDRRTKPGDLCVDRRSKIVDHLRSANKTRRPLCQSAIQNRRSPLIGEQNPATYVSIGDLKSSITFDRRTKLGDLCVDRRSKIVDHLRSANKTRRPLCRSAIQNRRSPFIGEQTKPPFCRSAIQNRRSPFIGEQTKPPFCRSAIQNRRSPFIGEQTKPPFCRVAIRNRRSPFIGEQTKPPILSSGDLVSIGDLPRGFSRARDTPYVRRPKGVVNYNQSGFTSPGSVYCILRFQPVIMTARAQKKPRPYFDIINRERRQRKIIKVKQGKVEAMPPKVLMDMQCKF